MFFRLLVFTIVGIVVYRVVKSWMMGSGGNEIHGSPTPQKVDDVMIKDPVCGTYFAKRDGVALETPREILYFCSHECRNSYTAKQNRAS